MDDDTEYQKLRRNMEQAQGTRTGNQDGISTVVYSVEGEEVGVLGSIIYRILCYLVVE